MWPLNHSPIDQGIEPGPVIARTTPDEIDSISPPSTNENEFASKSPENWPPVPVIFEVAIDVDVIFGAFKFVIVDETDVRSPTTSPVTLPVTDPVRSPTTSPVTLPVTDPVKFPTTSPVTLPVTDPFRSPTTSPVTLPVTDPVKFPTTSPVTLPVNDVAIILPYTTSPESSNTISCVTTLATGSKM